MRKNINFLLGLVLGMALVTTTGAASVVLQATPSSHSVRVNGEYVDIQGYLIDGHNYYQLRDLGELLGFDVEWDANDHCVSIRTESAKAGSSTLRYIPAVGDVITCTDGFLYEITDVSMWNNSMFASESLAALPSPTCDWSLLPQPDLPEVENRHFTAGGKEYLFMRNLYETRRMEYTIYNAAMNFPELWEGSTPNLNLHLGISAQNAVQMFWPWQEDQLTQVFRSAPGARFEVEAWDVYHNGKYLYTEYNIRGT